MATVASPEQMLTGDWKVQRVGGFLPPFGVYKRIRGNQGMTYLGPLPMGAFEVVGQAIVSFIYRRWPIRDEVRMEADGTWTGRGLFFEREFCRFRLVPRKEHVLVWRRTERLAH